MLLSRNRSRGHPGWSTSSSGWGLAPRGVGPEPRGDGWAALVVGDMRQPRGGPMCSGHASHQMGLDVDLWLIPAPHPGLSAAEREELSAVSILRPGVRAVD